MKTLNLKYLVLCLGVLLFACSEDDEACTEQVYYQDADGDGEGNRNSFVTSCNALSGFVLNSTDPDDRNSAVTSENIWNGPAVTFTKADNADWTLPANQDAITPNVVITRQDREGIFNIAVETDFNSSSSPAGTLWAQGTLSNIQNLEFEDFRDALNNNIGDNVLNGPMVCYLIQENVFLQVTFTSWTMGNNGGGFSYMRTTQ